MSKLLTMAAAFALSTSFAAQAQDVPDTRQMDSDSAADAVDAALEDVAEAVDEAGDWSIEWGSELEVYGDPGLDGESRYEGEEIETPEGTIVKYRIVPDDAEDLDVDGENLSLVNMTTGKSRLLLPEGSDQLLFNWTTLEVPRRWGDDEVRQVTVAYVALVGTRQDYADGRLDLIIGRFSDLEQVTLAKRLRFVDAANTIDRDTVTLIAWDGPNSAEFLKIRLVDFAIVERAAIELPMPKEIIEVSIPE
ncbi:hypothetical protein [Parerythrobacter aestuarii]|uniref:hypothetical protein n=1 Tax=Parerythrobacter aestuarii TaxID=3020909 RepID=UPI0024DEE9D6|nr:hypothetical protein [Parerythrobacter aestuarii]